MGSRGEKLTPPPRNRPFILLSGKGAAAAGRVWMILGSLRQYGCVTAVYYKDDPCACRVMELIFVQEEEGGGGLLPDRGYNTADNF